MSAQSSYLNKKGLTVKDLVTIGIFTALFFVFELIGSLPAKVPKRGGIVVLGIINGIIWYVLGMHWAMDLGYVVMGIVAEIVAGAKGYRNIKWNIASFSLFCLGPAGVFLAYFADPAAWAETMLNNGTSQEYIDMMTASAPAGMLPVILLGTIVLGIISGLVGKKLLKKQFEKAGITA